MPQPVGPHAEPWHLSPNVPPREEWIGHAHPLPGCVCRSGTPGLRGQGRISSVQLERTDPAFHHYAEGNHRKFASPCPSTYPGVIATSIFTFIVSWNDYLFALVLMTEEERRTLPVGLSELLNRACIAGGAVKG